MTFITNGQYHFFPQNTGLKLNNTRSSRSAPPIRRLYAAITAGCWIFCFRINSIHLFALPTGCTPYALLPIVTTELPFHLTISMLPSLLKLKDSPLFFSLFFWHQLEDISLSYHFSLWQLPWIPWLPGHISMNTWKEVLSVNAVIFWIFTNFQRVFNNAYTQRFINTLTCPSLINFDFIRDSCCTG